MLQMRPLTPHIYANVFHSNWPNELASLILSLMIHLFNSVPAFVTASPPRLTLYTLVIIMECVCQCLYTPAVQALNAEH